MGSSKFREVQLQDIIDEPKRFGAPTFSEFCKNPDKWRGREDESLEQVDVGSKRLDNVKEQLYEIDGYRCKTLHEVERVALGQGINLRDLVYKAEVLNEGGQQQKILVKFSSKVKPNAK